MGDGRERERGGEMDGSEREREKGGEMEGSEREMGRRDGRE